MYSFMCGYFIYEHISHYKANKNKQKNVKTHFCNMMQLCTKLKNKIYFTTKSSVIDLYKLY